MNRPKNSFSRTRAFLLCRKPLRLICSGLELKMLSDLCFWEGEDQNERISYCIFIVAHSHLPRFSKCDPTRSSSSTSTAAINVWNSPSNYPHTGSRYGTAQKLELARVDRGDRTSGGTGLVWDEASFATGSHAPTANTAASKAGAYRPARIYDISPAG